jgi:hypothetical protein
MSSYCTPVLLSQLLATKAIPARSQQSAVIVDCWRDARAASDLEDAELNIVLTEIALLRACCRVHNDISGCAFIAFCYCMSLFKRLLRSAPFKWSCLQTDANQLQHGKRACSGRRGGPILGDLPCHRWDRSGEQEAKNDCRRLKICDS